jgi:hypothetical protein
MGDDFIIVLQDALAQEKSVETARLNEEKRKKQSPNNRKACHRISTAPMQQSVAEI